MRIKSKEKTNQYINETELKSLMIRINNKSFKVNLSNSFKRLDKYIKKHQITQNKQFKYILEQKIVKIINKLINSKFKQLMLISDDVLANIKKRIIEYNEILNDITLYIDEFDIKNDESFNVLKLSFVDIMTEMNAKNYNLNNSRLNDIKRIDKYILKHSKSKTQKFKRLLREYIVLLSERNVIQKESYERFGEMVLLIIKNILKKPKFSGYSYRDEFYSDSTDKILRYLKNFNHKMISSMTGQEVSAFSYLSQYVHNSILFIINTKKTEKAEIEKYVNTYNENITLIYNESSYYSNDKEVEIELKEIQIDLYTDILNETEEYNEYNIIKIIYPETYKISIQEYQKLTKLKDLLNKQFQVIRKRK